VRRRPARAASRVLATAAATALLLGACGTDGPPTAAPTGLQVSLDTQESPGDDGSGTVDWEASWELVWVPLPDATGYVARWSTSEGTPETEPEPVEGTSLEVDVAAGSSPPERVSADLSAGVLFTSSQLSVSVAGVGEDGTTGPWSVWVPVGDVPADGRPVGSRGP